MSTLRELLNRAQWRDSLLHTLEIHVVHRGADGDRRVIPGARVVGVRSGGVELSPEVEGGDEVFVPYHRFLAIVDASGAELWSKDRGEAFDAGTSALTDTRAVVPAASSPKEITSDIEVILRRDDGLLVLDGSAGEGGGQILRTSLALSITTGKPFALENIRARRKKPGLMRQHLTSVKAAALVCGAEVEGATIGSSRVVFRPKAVVGGEHTIEIGSAGSISLVLQTIALPLVLATTKSRVVVRGGTHTLWAPPFPFLAGAWLPLVRRAGAEIDLELRATGFYPAGGGEVVMTTTPKARLLPLHLGEPTTTAPLELHAIVAGLSEGIARRELAAAAELLTDSRLTLASETVRSVGPGNAIWLTARDEGTGLVNVFSAVGEVGVPAEEVGRSVAQAFLTWRESGAALEPHIADQVMLPIALAGGGSYTTNELTLHSRTNIEVIGAFTDRRFHVAELDACRFRVALTS